MNRFREKIQTCFDSQQPTNALRAQALLYLLGIIPALFAIPLPFLTNFVSDTTGLVLKFLQAALLFYALVLTLFFLTFVLITLFHWMMRSFEGRENNE